MNPTKLRNKLGVLADSGKSEHAVATALDGRLVSQLSFECSMDFSELVHDSTFQ